MTRTALTEAQLQACVLDLAKLYGLKAHHCRPARTATGWATPISGDRGFPDLVIAGCRVIYRELKAEGGRVSPDQVGWLHTLAAAGVDAQIWRPRDWPERITAELQALRAVAS